MIFTPTILLEKKSVFVPEPQQLYSSSQVHKLLRYEYIIEFHLRIKVIYR